MKIKCEYCDNFIDDTAEKCDNCGAVNEHLVRVSGNTPKTIEELKAFCNSKNLPLEKMRFFIGQDYKGARAFGIYQNEAGEFVVYKNKNDGSRMERYRGKDEAYAVNEIYQKLRNEVIDRKETGKIVKRTEASHHSTKSNNTNGHSQIRKPAKKEKLIKLGIVIFVFVLVCFSCAVLMDSTPDAGYYEYNGADYYNDYNHWYLYDEVNEDWIIVECPEELEKHYKDFFVAPRTAPDDYSDDMPYPIFIDTYGSSYSSDYDSSYDYDYDYDDDDDDGWWSDWDSSWDDDDWDYDYSGWDSGDTDWGSDW